MAKTSYRGGRKTSMARLSRATRPTAIGVLLAAGALTLAACSSGSSAPSASGSASSGGSSSASSGQAKALPADLQAIETQPTFAAPGSALNAKTLPSSTPIVVIDNTPSVAPLQETSAGVMAAAKAAGFSPKLLNGGANNTPSDDINLLQQAVNLHPKVVLQVGIITALETAGLQYAKQHGVPVIAVDDDQPKAGAAGEGSGPLVAATAADDYTGYGKILAEYVAANGPANATIGAITSNDIVPSNIIFDTFKADLKTLCPGCTIYTQNVDTASWSTQITPTVTSLLDAHPNLTYLFPIVDGMAPLVSSALSAGRSLQVISANATPGSAMASVKSGQFSAEVGGAPQEIGWYAFDAALRVMLNLPAQANPNEPMSLFTTDLMKTKNLDPNDGEALFGTAYESGFLKLWGISSS
jgi:ribose transport system substrate-binding protein